MKKVLIWDEFKMSNIGGPMGYCYNIHEYLKENPTDQITFLSDLLPSENRKEVNATNKVKKKGVLYDFFYTCITFLFCHYRLGGKKIPSSIDLNEYDYVHFHLTNNAAKFLRNYNGYRGKTILTSHTPCPRTIEVFANQPKWKKIFWNLEMRREAQTYSEVDYVMFPCKDAREPYEKYPIMKRAFEKNDKKFFYNPSAILDLKINEETMQKYSQLGIPDNAFVITYFGRHISVKGYDILKQVGNALLDKYPNLYFLCAGKGDIEPLKHPRWKELGFIHNANELMAQSSLYILPNRETYFDLVTLEILRAGIPLILSDTGGNKFFKELPSNETEGMHFFNIDDVVGLINKVVKIIEIKRNSPLIYNKFKIDNRNLFLKYFTIDKFVNSYIDIINNLGVIYSNK